MLAVVQTGSSTLRSECMTARMVLVWAKVGEARSRAALTAESKCLTFTRTSSERGPPGPHHDLERTWRSALRHQLCQREVARAPGAMSASLGACTLAMCS